MTSDAAKASRYLSYLLRHNPAAIGVSLDDEGWISIDVLLAAAARHGGTIDADAIEQILSQPGKRRFETRAGKIRAAQGHSIPIDLRLPASTPPAVLYHGTAARFLPAIVADGLRPGERNHVHLSVEPATAHAVGARHGAPVILAIDAAAMNKNGHSFHRAANGVWLTNHVPPQWLRVLPEDWRLRGRRAAV